MLDTPKLYTQTSLAGYAKQNILGLTLQKNCIVTLTKKYLLIKVQVAIIPCISIFTSLPSLIRVTAIFEPFFENKSKILCYSNIEFSKKNRAFKKININYGPYTES